MRGPPVIVVLGTTGVGKTKLALEIASKLNGQIINADSMQVYKGLDIITNKPTLQERSTVKHHLFDFVSPLKEYSVIDFVADALQAIKNIHDEKSIPVIVGGTNYYIQSLLYEKTTIETSDSMLSKYTGMSSCHEGLISNDPILAQKLSIILGRTNPKTNSALKIFEFVNKECDIHAALTEIDVVMSERWHPKDFRKIRRSIEIFFTTGKKHSDLLLEQKKQESKLRFRTCAFWLYGTTEKLNERLDDRVDQMIDRGLFDEMKDFQERHQSGSVVGINNFVPDYTRGILQSIGFKEFKSFLELHPDSPDYERVKFESIDRMKITTRQYATTQITWLKNKLCKALVKDHEKGEGAIYILNATDLNKWDSISSTAISFSESFLKNEPNHETTSDEELKMLVRPQTFQYSETWKKYTCDICTDNNGKNLIFNGDHEWNVHMKSRRHWKTVKHLKHQEEISEYLKNKN